MNGTFGLLRTQFLFEKFLCVSVNLSMKECNLFRKDPISDLKFSLFHNLCVQTDAQKVNFCAALKSILGKNRKDVPVALIK